MFEKLRADHPLAAHVPQWLVNRLAKEVIHPGYARTSEMVALFADLAAFTPLTEAMARRGPQGVEALTKILDTVLGTLVETLLAYGGDIVNFSGDAMTAFWPLEAPPQSDRGAAGALQAVAAARAIQAVMRRFDEVVTPAGTLPLAMRVGLGYGPGTLLVVGSPEQQYVILTGPSLTRATDAEREAPRGHIVLHPSLRERVATAVKCDGAGVLEGVETHVPLAPPGPVPAVEAARLRPFVSPALAERVETGREAFLADFRHDVVPLFVSFTADTPADIQEYVVQALPVLERHGGYYAWIEIGDKGNLFIVLFGVPLTRGDNSTRAASCALDLAALPATTAIGVSTGGLFAGVMGSPRRCQYTAIGDAMNRASRLMEAAGEAEERPVILTEARVRREAGDRFIYGERRSLQVRGKTDRVTVVRLLGRAQHWGDWLGPWIDQGDVIGRREEVAWLDGHVARSMGGQGQVLTIVGEVGVGKSHLVGELLRRWLQRGGRAYLGAALASAQHSPYYAWSGLLRAFFDLRGDAGDPARMEAVLGTVNPDLKPRLPLLAGIVGVELPGGEPSLRPDAGLREESLRAMVADLVRDEAGRQPLLLVLEDAHWLDQLSWEMALSVARATRDVPVLLCLTHCPLGEPLPEAWDALASLEQHASLSLGEMSPEDAVALARARLGVASLPPELAALVQTKAQGYPLFIEEMLNALRDSGAIRIERGRVVIEGDLSQTDLPDAVQGIVQARIDGLDEDARLTLMVASVIGLTFPFHTLRTVHPAHPSDAQLHAQLGTLERLGIVQLERPEPDLTYSFKHTITQEVTYQTLSFAQRRTLHRAVDEWHEATAGESEGRQA